MPEVVYKPTSEYKKEFDTPISKTNLKTGIILFGKRIMLQAVGTVTGATIYEVPLGKTFFLTNASINNAVNATGVNTRMYTGSLLPYQDHLLFIHSSGLALTGVLQDRKEFDFLKFVATEKINISADAGNIATGTIIGYEIESVLLPTFN